MEGWSLFFSGVTAVGTLALAVAAFMALGAWRKQMVASRKAQIAEDVLADFHRFRRYIGQIRSPAYSHGELGQDEVGSAEAEGTARADRAVGAIYERRVNAREHFFERLQDRRYSFEAFFGPDYKGPSPFDEARDVAVSVWSSARSIQRVAGRIKGQGDLDRHFATIWEDHADPDPIKPRMDAAIAKIETICLPAIRAQAAPGKGQRLWSPRTPRLPKW
jgi:hypothetical protein